MLEEQDGRLRGLINMGKERGYILFDEVSEVLPRETHSAEEIDGLFSAFEGHNIHLCEDPPAAMPSSGGRGGTERVESEMAGSSVPAEESELDQAAQVLDTTSDPVRLYLREMGSVPLLRREEEVAIAKRMERGEALVLKTASRSPIVLKELIGIGRELRNGTRSIREVVHFGEEELTAEEIAKKASETLRIIDRIKRLYGVGLNQAARLNNIPRSKRRAHLRARRKLSRTRIEMSRLARSLGLHPVEKKRLIEKLRHEVERLRCLESETSRSVRCAGPTKRKAVAIRKDRRVRPLAAKGNRGIERGRAHRPETFARPHPARRGRSPTSEEGVDRGKPSSCSRDRQEVCKPGVGVSRLDPGGEYWPDAGGRKIRLASWVQVLHLCHVVDSASGFTCDRR